MSNIEIDNSTTRALVKRQMEEFSQIHYLIEINKYSFERLEKSFNEMPIYQRLEDTDDYINRYLPLKIQNMIDDTLFNCLDSTSDLSRLQKYEEKIFKQLDGNITSK